jgi:hypothetical protein
MAIHLQISETNRAYAVINSVKEQGILDKFDWPKILDAAETHKQLQLCSIWWHQGEASHIVVCPNDDPNSSEAITLFADNNADITVWIPSTMPFGCVVDKPQNMLAELGALGQV